MIRHLLLSVLWLVAVATGGSAQTVSRYGPVDENLLAETKWRYAYALHVESNTVIHRADEAYDFFLWLRYDFTYQEYLNGTLRRGTWSLNGRTLFYSFKNIRQFEIAEVSKQRLVLEFNQPNSTGTYQYHYVRVSSGEAPFVRPDNELPEVLVEDLLPQKKQQRWLSFNTKKRRKRKQREALKDKTYISIELIGGGYYGGIDPVLRDFIHIKNDGRLIKEYQSRQQGLQVVKKDIPREELEAFADYLIRENFFELERLYDCADRVCLKRKQQDPPPIPLRLAVTYGSRRKVITIPVYGQDEYKQRYIPYPPLIDEAVDVVRRMADRSEALVRK